jgi:hypothetical protein
MTGSNRFTMVSGSRVYPGVETMRSDDDVVGMSAAAAAAAGAASPAAIARLRNVDEYKRVASLKVPAAPSIKTRDRLAVQHLLDRAKQVALKQAKMRDNYCKYRFGLTPLGILRAAFTAMPEQPPVDYAQLLAMVEETELESARERVEEDAAADSAPPPVERPAKRARTAPRAAAPGAPTEEALHALHASGDLGRLTVETLKGVMEAFAKASMACSRRAPRCSRRAPRLS